MELGWVDGTNAALTFTLPRIELRSSPHGWALDESGSLERANVRVANTSAAHHSSKAGAVATLPWR